MGLLAWFKELPGQMKFAVIWLIGIEVVITMLNPGLGIFIVAVIGSIAAFLTIINYLIEGGVRKSRDR